MGLSPLRYRDGSKRPFSVVVDLLWTAPEQLRGSGGPGKASFKGDVFSLGIVLQEVLTRGPPYCSWGLSAEGMHPPVRAPAVAPHSHSTVSVQSQRPVL